MKWKDYASSQLIEQGTLLKKFNKLLDIIEETKIPKVYQVTFEMGGIDCVWYLYSSTPITEDNFLDNVYKFVKGTYDEDCFVFIPRYENGEMTIVGLTNSGRYFTETSDVRYIQVKLIGDL
jgi:hypothetical protein